MNARKRLAQDRSAVHQAGLLVLWESQEAQLVHGVPEGFGPSGCSTFNVSNFLGPSSCQSVLTFIVCEFGKCLSTSRVWVGKVNIRVESVDATGCLLRLGLREVPCVPCSW
jgi:hypothetical protein